MEEYLQLLGPVLSVGIKNDQDPCIGHAFEKLESFGGNRHISRKLM